MEQTGHLEPKAAFDTVLKVCHALGIQFTPTPVATSIPGSSR